MFFLLEYTWDIYLHSATAYVAMAIAIPVALAMLSRASQHRWAATSAASVYTIFVDRRNFDSAAVSGAAETGAGIFSGDPSCSG